MRMQLILSPFQSHSVPSKIWPPNGIQPLFLWPNLSQISIPPFSYSGNLTPPPLIISPPPSVPCVNLSLIRSPWPLIQSVRLCFSAIRPFPRAHSPPPKCHLANPLGCCLEALRAVRSSNALCQSSTVNPQSTPSICPSSSANPFANKSSHFSFFCLSPSFGMYAVRQSASYSILFIKLSTTSQYLLLLNDLMTHMGWSLAFMLSLIQYFLI